MRFERWWAEVSQEGAYRTAMGWAKFGWDAASGTSDNVIETMPVMRDEEVVFEVEIKLLLDKPNELCESLPDVPTKGRSA